MFKPTLVFFVAGLLAVEALWTILGAVLLVAFL